MSQAYNRGMIYVDHDFTANYLNAVGTKDDFMQRDIVVDEIAKLIVEQTKDIVDLLRANGFNVSIKDNIDKITETLKYQLEKGNKNIIQGLTVLIAERNNVDLNFSFDWGSTLTAIAKGASIKDTAKSSLTNKENLVDLGNVIASGITSTFNKPAPSNTAPKVVVTTPAKTSASKLLSERVKLNQMTSLQKSTMPTWAKVSLISAGSLLLLTLVILIIRRAKSGSSSSSVSVPVETTTIAT